MELVLEDETYAIRGAIYEVYKNLGSGFLEAVYQEALEMELASRGIPFKAQAEIEIKYKGKLLKQSYRADLLCYDKIILELKKRSKHYYRSTKRNCRTISVQRE